MPTQGKGTYEVTGWDEEPYEEKPGEPKLTKAHINSTFSGDIEGDGSAEYLMAYPSETFASFVGLHRVSGRVAGRQGSFVLQAAGTFENGVAKASWFVVPGSGTGELSGLQGSGGYVARSGTTCDVTLDFDFPDSRAAVRNGPRV